ncbi:oligogalacturonide transport system substrate-binding protein [Biostraticola tofi]|uniref:Oligogalacturonide transport system substrate-binding protein n=2 Tax=Biostraticola tofi TaxID=466109 RepID=A0A4R3YZI0_9GAMM|nr:ABC transporter substrate-binding protein [Biostraticola tofi]TCV98710.1 oligogalacturonide transport system substrate-binding protein [Biostraticola tofi]
MAKLFAPVAASLLLACSLVAAAEPVDIRISWWGGNSRHQATLQAIELFEKKYPDIKVKAEYAGWEGYLSRLTVQIAGGSEPDVIQTNWNWLPVFSQTGTGFYDLNTLKADIDLSQYDPGTLASVTVNNKLNGIPVAITARSFYYNKKLWEEMGVSYPQSWQELMAAGKAFQVRDQSKYPLVLDYMESLTLVQSWMVQKYNIAAIDEQKMKFNYTPEQWVEFFQIYKDLVDSHVFPSMRVLSSYGKSNTWEMKPWIAGQWGGVYMWNTNAVMYENNLSAPYNKLELGPFFMLPGAKDAGLFLKPTMMFSVGKSTRHPAAAAKLIDFLMNDPQGVAAMGLERGTPQSKKAYQHLTAQGVIQPDNITVAGINASLALPHEIATSPYFDNPQLVELWHNTIEHLDQGNTTVKEAAANFSRSAERILKRAIKK